MPGDADLQTRGAEEVSPDKVCQDRPSDVAAVQRRVWRNILVVVTITIGVAAIVASRAFIFGVSLGGGLALLNFRWLETSLRATLEIGTKKAPPGTTLKLIFRWLVIGVIGYIAYTTGYFDPLGIVAGLLAPAVAVMIEAGYQTYRTLTQHGER
jgi:ATP synthase I subunit